ncbi:MAG: hypothetical protein ACLVKA_11265, partial [Collinsella aerofaciens]
SYMRLAGTLPALLFGKIRPRPGDSRVICGFLRSFDRPLPQALPSLYKRITIQRRAWRTYYTNKKKVAVKQFLLGHQMAHSRNYSTAT